MSYLGRSAKLSLKAQEKVSFLATAGQTSKTGLSYTPTFVEVYVNGVLLTDTTDFTATNGNSITFTVALLVNDEVTVISLKTFTVADHYNKTQADVLLAAKLPLAGGTLTGDVSHGDNVKAKFGASDDLEIYHNGSNSYIKDAGTGNLNIITNGPELALLTQGGLEYGVRIIQDGAVEIRHDDSTKLATTSTGVDVTGTVTADALTVDGFTALTRDNNKVMTMDRLTSDGEILRFNKDGTTVGSIGSYAGAYPYVGQTGSTLLFNGSTSEILPRGTNGAAKDGLIDLANGNNRFKDLYLSGGVYLGGTGAANFLQDYESGTWTPSFVSTNSTTPTGSMSHTGYYTKIGRQVNLIGYMQISTGLSVGGGTLGIAGIPFTAITGDGKHPSGTLLTSSWDNDRTANVGVTIYDTTRIGFLTSNHDTAWAWEQTYSLNNYTYMRFSLTYFTA